MMISFNKQSLIICVLFFSTTSFAGDRNGGGSLVGNGAGLAEQEAVYAYVRLPQVIDFCLETKTCGLQDSDLALVLSVRAALEENKDVRKKIQFVSEKEVPGFFNTGESEHHRVAKTFVDQSSLIYINRDALYLEDGKLAVELPAFASILFHEFGHQAGELDHSYLDSIGAKLRIALEKRKFLVEHPKLDLVAAYYQNTNPIGLSDLFLRIGQYSYDVTSRVAEALPCPGARGAIGYQLLNTHWRNGSTINARWVLSTFVRYTCVARDGAGTTQALAELNILVPAYALSPPDEPLSSKELGIVIQ